MTIDGNLTTDEIVERAEEAYYFTYPMLQGYQAIFGISLAEGAPTYYGPINTVHSRPMVLGPSFTAVVSPNADTPYTAMMLDLRAEPMVFHVPPIEDRYYVMQMVDLYGYNAHYVGTRVTGTGAGSYLLAGPRWDGEVPEGITDVLRFETDLVLGIGRTQLLGPDDLPKLKEIVANYRLEPLSSFAGTPAPPSPPSEWPMWDPSILDDERFIGMANWLFTFCQAPHPEDAEALARMASIGIGPGTAFDPDTLTDEQRAAIRAGIETAKRRMAERARNLSQSVNGWQSLAGFGPRSYFHGDYLLKAAAATVGYLANDREEADYPVCRVDADGEKLNGAHRYRLTFSESPPNDAFWSVTMYNTLKDGTGGFMVENPLDRYLINTATEGLVMGDDGSLTVAIQHDEPTDPTERANWLPAPKGDFYFILRIYMPKQAVLDGTWEPPPDVRIA